jgi:hypothetical protein
MMDVTKFPSQMRQNVITMSHNKHAVIRLHISPSQQWGTCRVISLLTYLLLMLLAVLADLDTQFGRCFMTTSLRMSSGRTPFLAPCSDAYRTNVAALWLAPLLRIREVPGSDLGQVTGCFD